jgi:WXXGXW repeat (2 copies)
MRILISFRSLFVVLAMLAVSGACFAQVSVGISVGFAPPELPVYEQPICPGDGYIWTPGYWAWDGDVGDYYWVPGTWVMAPQVGFLWTPGWWGWGGSAFIFHEGYWGPVVGFYGGINYGYGYFGRGYEGGRWDHDHFYYNRSVNNVNVTQIHNVYNTTVVNNYNTPRVSYNGGRGGINERPTAQEEAASREHHIAPVAAQTQHFQAARNNQEMRASVNHGKPPIAATPKPAAFNEHGAVPARTGGNYNPPPRSANNERPATANNERPANGNANVNTHPVHPNDLQPHERPTPPNTGNQKQDQKYQQQQQKLYDQQIKDHQKLQQKQDQEHQKVEKQNQDAARKQQVQQQTEQKHQQQTQQMEQKHTQQQQHMQTHQQPPHPAQQPPHPAAPPPHENPPPHH